MIKVKLDDAIMFIGLATPPAVTNILVTKMPTRNLFAVANFLVYSLLRVSFYAQFSVLKLSRCTVVYF